MNRYLTRRLFQILPTTALAPYGLYSRNTLLKSFTSTRSFLSSVPPPPPRSPTFTSTTQQQKGVDRPTGSSSSSATKPPPPQNLTKAFPKEDEIRSLQREKQWLRDPPAQQSYNKAAFGMSGSLEGDPNPSTVPKKTKSGKMISPAEAQKLVSDPGSKSSSRRLVRRALLLSVELLLLTMGVGYIWDNLPPLRKWLHEKNPSIAQKMDVLATSLHPWTDKGLELANQGVKYVMSLVRRGEENVEKSGSSHLMQQSGSTPFPIPLGDEDQQKEGLGESDVGLERHIGEPSRDGIGGSQLTQLGQLEVGGVEPLEWTMEHVEKEFDDSIGGRAGEVSSNQKEEKSQIEELKEPPSSLGFVSQFESSSDDLSQMEGNTEEGQEEAVESPRVGVSGLSPVDETAFESDVQIPIVEAENQEPEKLVLFKGVVAHEGKESVEDHPLVAAGIALESDDQARGAMAERFEEAPSMKETELMIALKEALKMMAQKSEEVEKLMQSNYELEAERRKSEWKQLTETLIKETEDEIRREVESEASAAINALEEDFIEGKKKLLEDVAGIKGKSEVIEQAVDEITNRLTTSLQHVKCSNTLSKIERNLSTRRPIGPALEELQTMTSNDEFIQTIISLIPSEMKERLQTEPIASTDNLTKQFDEVYRDALQACFVPPDGGLLGHLQAFIFKMVYSTTGSLLKNLFNRNQYNDQSLIRRSLAILQRAKYYNQNGNLQDCQELMSSLNNELSKEISSEWIREAQMTLTIQNVMDVLRSHLRLQTIAITPESTL